MSTICPFPWYIHFHQGQCQTTNMTSLNVERRCSLIHRLSWTSASSRLPLPQVPHTLGRQRMQRSRDTLQGGGDGLRLVSFKHLCRAFDTNKQTKNRLWETLRHLYYKQLPYCWNRPIPDLTLIICNVKQIYSPMSMGGRAGRGRTGPWSHGWCSKSFLKGKRAPSSMLVSGFWAQGPFWISHRVPGSLANLR